MNITRKLLMSVTLMAVSLLFLASCASGDAPAPAGGAAGGGGGAAGGAEAATGAQAQPADDFSEHYVFSIAVLNADAGVNYNADDVARHFSEMFNFSLEVIPLTFADWNDMGRIWISAQDMPDMIHQNFSFIDYASWIDQGLIRRFPDNWKATYPNLAAVFDLSMIGPALESVIPGEQALFPNVPYFSTRPTDPKLAPHFSFIFRRDWASALGFEIKDGYTLDEIGEMLDTFMREGSSIPGVDMSRIDTFNLDSLRVARVYMTSQWADWERFFRDESGQYVWGPRDPRTFDLLQSMQDAIHSGQVSRNFASFQGEEQDHLFYAGQAFGIFSHGWVRPIFANWSRFTANTGLDAAEALHIAVILDEDGNFQEYEQLNFWSCFYFCPRMSDSKFNRMLTFFDYLVTEEAQNMVRMGIEGRDWNRDGGEIVITREWLEETGNFIDLHDLYPVTLIYNSFLILGDDFGARDPAIPELHHTLARNKYAVKQTQGVDTGTLRPFNWEVEFFQGDHFRRFPYSTTTANLNNLRNAMVQIAMEPGDLRENYERWLQERAAMVDPVLAELNAAFGG